MSISFLGTKVTNLSLVVNEDNEVKLEDNFKLSYLNGYSEENEKAFIVKFFVNLSSEEENFVLNLEYVGLFESEENISEKFKESHFPLVNAPAIAYPFLRSFVNTITVNANLNPVILPTINFQELAKSQEVKP